MKNEELLSIVNRPKVLERTIRLSKDIDENTIDALLEKILKFYQQDPNEYIVLHSSTSGGITTQAISYFETIRIYRPKLITIVSGRCYSGGILILLASEPGLRIATQSTHFLIHPTRSLMDGNYGLPEIQEKIKYLTDLEDINLKIFLKETKMTKKQFKKEKTNDVYSNVDQALRWGLISKII